jgi:hypothetical protein
MSDRQLKPCPICSIPSPYWDRYPRLVCSTCRSKACDSQGRKVEFFNDFNGGFLGFIADTQAEYPSHLCYIEGQVLGRGRKIWRYCDRALRLIRFNFFAILAVFCEQIAAIFEIQDKQLSQV